MGWELELTREFEKGFSKLSSDFQKRVIKALRKLQHNPERYKSLRHLLKGLRRIRVGKYRIAYEIRKRKVYVLYVAHRKNVYTRILFFLKHRK